MIYLYIDLILNSFLFLPSCLIILNLKNKNIYEFILFIMFIYIIFGPYLAILLIILKGLYKVVLKGYDSFFKDMVFLFIFLLYLSIFHYFDSIFLYLFYNISFYYSFNFFTKNKLDFSSFLK